MNELMFEALNLEEKIHACCMFGTNITFFSLEGQSNKK